MFDCKQWLNITPSTNVLERWMGIDHNVILQWHRFSNRVPATFPPRQENETPNLAPQKQQRKRRRSAKGKEIGRGAAAAQEYDADDDSDD